MNQSTLAGAVRFDGVGLHTGTRASVEIHPAPIDFGVQFVVGETIVPAIVDNVVDTSRATVLGKERQRISTVEHLLSALFGMEVTNARVIVHGEEIPVVDGSAQVFADAFAAVGIAPQHAPASLLRLSEPFDVRDGESALIFLPSDALRVRFIADFPAPIGLQYLDVSVDARTYRSEIAPARTFGYLHEVEALRARGLALGGTLENALVFAPSGAMQELRWPNEVVRHKILDLLGDLALLGRRPSCDIIAIRTGHALHVDAVRRLRERYERDGRSGLQTLGARLSD